MLLTVNKFGSTNMSLRRSGRRRLRRSMRCCGERPIRAATVAQSLHAGAPTERRSRRIARLQLGHTCESLSTPGVDIEAGVSREAVAGQRGLRALADLQTGHRV